MTPGARVSGGDEMSEQEVIATILVNQKIMRNGSPPISNALDLLPEKLRDEVMDDAQAVIDGLKACRKGDEG
jgi:hypothetical protein